MLIMHYNGVHEVRIGRVQHTVRYSIQYTRLCYDCMYYRQCIYNII